MSPLGETTPSIEQLVDRLAASVLDGPGDLEPGVRRAIAACSEELAGSRSARSAPVPDEFISLVEKVALHAYKVTDSDIDGLKAAGWSEDAIFEAVVAAAVGAGRARFERGMAALTGRS